MKLLIALILFSNFCFAQKINIKNGQQLPLEGVSVFLSGHKNKLIAISDSFGTVNIDIQKDSTYLFHLLGYDDLSINASKLQKSNSIVLKSLSYRLNQIDIKKTRYKHVQLISKPGKFNFGAENTIRSVNQFVTTIEIEKAGFLNKFKLFAYQFRKGIPRKFQLIIFKSQDAKPGEQIFIENVEGILVKNRLVFDLSKFAPFLDSGTYFIGYQSMANDDFDQTKVSDYSFIMIKGKTIDVPRMYGRWNLKEWMPTRIVIPAKGKFTDMAYELEMDVIN
jgi:hypothetical protein